MSMEDNFDKMVTPPESVKEELKLADVYIDSEGNKFKIIPSPEGTIGSMVAAAYDPETKQITGEPFFAGLPEEVLEKYKVWDTTAKDMLPPESAK